MSYNQKNLNQFMFTSIASRLAENSCDIKAHSNAVPPIEEFPARPLRSSLKSLDDTPSEQYKSVSFQEPLE